MARYLVMRLAQGMLAIFLLSVLVFILARATGDPLQLFLPLEAPIEQQEAIARSLGLDKSYPEQFLTFVAGMLRGDFGDSVRYKVAAADLFWQRLPNTLRLMIPAFVIVQLLGVVTGVVAASGRGSLVSRLFGFVAVFGLAVPGFWIAVMLMLVFAVELGWLPAARMGGPEHFVLPLAALTVTGVAGTMRLTRSSMLEQLNSEYIKLARIKGVSEGAIVWKHALKNSLTAVVASMGTSFALLLTGSILIENVFAWPGTGRLLHEGISNRDFPIVQTLVIFQGAFLVLINLGADLLQALIDPRVRITGSR